MVKKLFIGLIVLVSFQSLAFLASYNELITPMLLLSCERTNHFTKNCPRYNPEKREHNTEMNIYTKLKRFDSLISLISKKIANISILKHEPLTNICHRIGTISALLKDIFILKESYKGSSAESIKDNLDEIKHEHEMSGFCQETFKYYSARFLSEEGFFYTTIDYKDKNALQKLVLKYQQILAETLPLIRDDLGLLEYD